MGEVEEDELEELILEQVFEEAEGFVLPRGFGDTQRRYKGRPGEITGVPVKAQLSPICTTEDT